MLLESLLPHCTTEPEPVTPVNQIRFKKQFQKAWNLFRKRILKISFLWKRSSLSKLVSVSVLLKNTTKRTGNNPLRIQEGLKSVGTLVGEGPRQDFMLNSWGRICPSARNLSQALKSYNRLDEGHPHKGHPPQSQPTVDVNHIHTIFVQRSPNSCLVRKLGTGTQLS